MKKKHLFSFKTEPHQCTVNIFFYLPQKTSRNTRKRAFHIKNLFFTQGKPHQYTVNVFNWSSSKSLRKTNPKGVHLKPFIFKQIYINLLSIYFIRFLTETFTRSKLTSVSYLNHLVFCQYFLIFIQNASLNLFWMYPYQTRQFSSNITLIYQNIFLELFFGKTS